MLLVDFMRERFLSIQNLDLELGDEENTSSKLADLELN